ncbi:signal peptidase I [Lacticaseibacillus camelliae]|uniref:Signal peptidase I n=1 Tax=Lacticaseibacillus camelliae DSM 22697 = JCM 13995 TaxID=1423730 RepID=A0A0R2F503_9LACO|nr:signal peptidase I [Lacticaseibacillus camelliae]KRN21397.1 hypothetical protein FC75_GL002313 [Lacticaseibacillus camelliae DSM 22697 = JCM 13995]
MTRKAVSRVLFVLMIVATLFSVLTPLESVRGQSMAPTLKSGQWLLVANYRLLRHTGLKPKQSDIVTFANADKVPYLPPRRQLVKRVIGMPGDLIGINQTKVYRNSRPLKEPYVKHPMDNAKYQYDGRPDGGQPFTDPSYQRSSYLRGGEYFVMGDNRPNSADSRWFGPIDRTQITGVVLAKLPIRRTGPAQNALWVLIHFLPMLLVVAWFLTACWPDLRTMLTRPRE